MNLSFLGGDENGEESGDVFLKSMFWKINVFFSLCILFMVLQLSVDLHLILNDLQSSDDIVKNQLILSSIELMFAITLTFYYRMFGNVFSVGDTNEDAPRQESVDSFKDLNNQASNPELRDTSKTIEDSGQSNSFE